MMQLKGMDKLLSTLEQKLGKARMQAITDQALMEGAKVFVQQLKKEFESFRDKGWSIEEITISPPMTIGGVRTIKIYWRGPKGRYRIIHLNEWGTVKNPNPRGKGAIARAMRNAETAYRNAIAHAYRRLL